MFGYLSQKSCQMFGYLLQKNHQMSGYRLQKNHQMFVRLSFAKESSNIRLSFPPLDILWKEASSQIVLVMLNRRKKFVKIKLS